ncbi:MAG: MarR family transcriptional regulator [Anaerolineaceae bacterium]|nr:MarR family transcriptional regulator [Anaerolineaceae bacterium]
MDNEIYDSLDFLLHRVILAHRNLIRHKMEELGLHRGQPPVLFALQEHDGLPNSELAEFLHITPATLTNKVKRMEKAGLVIRRRDPEDERISRVFMTEKGRGIMNELHRSVMDREKILLEGFSAVEAEALKVQLRRVLGNIETSDHHWHK